MDWSAWQVSLERTREQDGQEMTVRTGQLGQDSWERTAVAGHSRGRIARTGKPGWDSRHRTAGVDSQDSGVRIETEDKTTKT